MKYLASITYWTADGVEHVEDGLKVYASHPDLPVEVEMASISAREWAKVDRGAVRTGDVELVPAWPTD